MNSWERQLGNYQSSLVRVTSLRSKLQKRYPGHYICIAVDSGCFGLGPPSENDKEGHQAAFADYESKFGKITEPTLFLGYRFM